MNPLIRSATAADQGALSSLDVLARALASAQRGGPELLRWSLVADLPVVGSAEWHVAVGDLGGAVVAVARMERCEDRAVLHQIFTHPQARGVGLGHLLLLDAQRVARSWGCRGVDAVALPGDRGTKNFFEAHAMKSRLLTVHATLEDS